jgi:organic radical activating enzyme
MFKSGITIQITPSFKCNLKCPYCTLYNFGDKLPKDNVEVNLGAWYQFIKTFPVKIKEVAISGGEPSLIKYIDCFINNLLFDGYFVTVYSNLTTSSKVFSNVIKSPRFKIQSTYHASCDLHKYKMTLRQLNKKHRVDVDEIETNFLKESKKKKLTTIENEKDKTCLRIAPDFKIYTSCFERNAAYINTDK